MDVLFDRFWASCLAAILPVSLSLATSSVASTCPDRDRDGFSPTVGCGTPIDGNDADLDSNPCAAEVYDGVDNDCDGLSDCEDEVACPSQGPQPAAVTGVRFLDETTLVWDAVSNADSYDVASGRLVDLRFEGDVRWTKCEGRSEPGTSLHLPEGPVLSDGFFYMIRAWTGEREACRVGSWGRPARDESSGSCP
jgi:hypothetical protein